MKTLFLLLGLFSFGIAEAQLGITPNQTGDLSCKLMKPAGRLKDGTLVYACISKQFVFSFVFQNIKIDSAQAISEGSSMSLNLHCTSAAPKGVFAYGGITPGFKNNQNFFYAVKEMGRCFVTGDAALINNTKFSKNSSFEIAPIGQVSLQ